MTRREWLGWAALAVVAFVLRKPMPPKPDEWVLEPIPNMYFPLVITPLDGDDRRSYSFDQQGNKFYWDTLDRAVKG